MPVALNLGERILSVVEQRASGLGDGEQLAGLCRAPVLSVARPGQLVEVANREAGEILERLSQGHPVGIR